MARKGILQYLRTSSYLSGGALSVTLLLWVYSLAIVAVGALPRLPAMASLGLVYAAALCLLWFCPLRSRLLPLLFVSFIGAGWALWHNQRALDQRLPLSAHGKDFVLQLEVVSLPEVRSGSGSFGKGGDSVNLRFSARVLKTQGGEAVSPPADGQLLDLTWYRITPHAQRTLRAGSRWELAVRLKRPRGSVNPHSFDYEGWLLQRGVYATGYVRPQDQTPRLVSSGNGLPALRHWLRDQLEQLSSRRPELMRALLLGDRGGLDRESRELLQKTGTAHLLAISGLHVGMVAAFFLLFGNLLARFWGLLGGKMPAGATVLSALAGALGYTLLAGMPLSAQRALVMISVGLLALLWRRRLGAGLAYALALAAVLTLQPLAFVNAGFWLSFVAVGALLLSFGGRQRVIRSADESLVAPSLYKRVRQWGMNLLYSQWVVTLALLLPSLYFFSGFSLSGLLLNLLAIPWLGLLILPALLLGVLLLGTPLGSSLLAFADWQLDLLLSFLAWSYRSLPAWQSLPLAGGAIAVLFAALSLLLILLPRGLPGRNLAWLVLLPLLKPWIAQPESTTDFLQVTILDVGQGLAVAVRTPQQQLLYDTGPRSDSGWSAGSEIIAPYLMGEGVSAVDMVVVSHGDRDHSGGLEGLAAKMPLNRIVVPGQLAQRLAPSLQGLETCIAGNRDQLGSLQVQWLWPESRDLSGEENDHSCVALIRWHGVRLLFVGDISSGVEQHISRRYADIGPVDLLIVPHHGSRTSSSAALIDWAQPRRVVFSAGFRHHFGHPHAAVVERYRASGARLFATADSGALKFTWIGDNKAPEVERARQTPRFWLSDTAVQETGERQFFQSE